MKFFRPDVEIEHYTELTADWLVTNQIKTIFSDLDSTLAAHNHVGDQQFEVWHEKVKSAGVTLVIVSNNNQGRVDRFTKPYNIIGFGHCNKPGVGTIKKHMKSVQAKSETSIFLGDQILTDVWCGKRLGMKTVLVHPIGPEHEPWNIVLKRKLEKIIRKGW
ncbi:YqeG family HAD IIIA-type phosphatase [Anaerobacillus sp. MEB173]|uniref:YqeG family HAD IIIA-type phosphatase n=1 Tax=Anaerobacillus sp. MEB173 TaxID=3383345 RepID=UPI003F8F195E